MEGWHGLSQETIAAVATPGGLGGIGILRLSGPEAWRVGADLFRPSRGGLDLGRPPLRQLLHGWALDPASGERVDEVLAVFFQAPHSYTTQDTVEIQGHGGPALLRRLLELALARGCRLARPGEFTWRAYLGGRLSLDQAEAVASLVAAQSQAEARLALAGLEGGLGRRLAGLRAGLLEAAAQVEAGIDFPEEMEGLDPLEMGAQLEERAASPLRDMLARGGRTRVYQEGAQVVLCGRPNVGKSSIFNALLGENRVIVSPISGTTRDSVEESLLLGGLRLRLVDTAGLGHGGAELEEEGRARARERLGQADLCLLVLDVSQPLTPQDWQVLEETRDRPRLILANKSDLAPAWSLKGAGLAGVEVSARGGQGLAALEQALVQALTGGEPEPQAGQWAVNARQGQGLARCLEAVEAAQAHLKDQAWELVSLELGQALASLGQVDGQDAPDQVLETVFAKFCLGK